MAREQLLRLQRVSAGYYCDRFARYAVEQHQDGWRWFDTSNPSTGGEWRSTKREATLDLMAYFGMAAEGAR